MLPEGRHSLDVPDPHLASAGARPEFQCSPWLEPKGGQMTDLSPGEDLAAAGICPTPRPIRFWSRTSIRAIKNPPDSQ